MKWFHNILITVFIVSVAPATSIADAPSGVSAKTEARGMSDANPQMQTKDSALTPDELNGIIKVKPKTNPNSKNSSFDSLITIIPLILLVAIAIPVLFGTILGLCGIIVVYASWWDIFLSAATFITFVFAVLVALIMNSAWYVFALPLALAIALLLRDRYLNRSLVKALIAFPTQIAGTAMIFILLILSISAIANAFKVNSAGHLKNSRFEIGVTLFIAGIFASLGAAAFKLIQLLLIKGRNNAARFGFDDLEEERCKRNGKKQKSMRDIFWESYNITSGKCDPDYKVKKEAESEQTEAQATESAVVKDEAYYAAVLGIKVKNECR